MSRRHLLPFEIILIIPQDEVFVDWQGFYFFSFISSKKALGGLPPPIRNSILYYLFEHKKPSKTY